jgi:hypothetical protein
VPSFKKLNDEDATGKELAFSIDCIEERSNGPSTATFAAANGLTVNKKYKMIPSMNSPTIPIMYMFIATIIVVTI